MWWVRSLARMRPRVCDSWSSDYSFMKVSWSCWDNSHWKTPHTYLLRICWALVLCRSFITESTKPTLIGWHCGKAHHPLRVAWSSGPSWGFGFGQAWVWLPYSPPRWESLANPQLSEPVSLPAKCGHQCRLQGAAVRIKWSCWYMPRCLPGPGLWDRAGLPSGSSLPRVILLGKDKEEGEYTGTHTHTQTMHSQLLGPNTVQYFSRWSGDLYPFLPPPPCWFPLTSLPHLLVPLSSRSLSHAASRYKRNTRSTK